MKKTLLPALLAVAFPALADSEVCNTYFQKMEEALKAEGNYSEEAMQMVKDQTASIPGEQQDAFCQAGIEGLSGQIDPEDTADDGGERKSS